MKSQKELTKELQGYWGVQIFNFEGEFAFNKNGKGYFRNILNPKDKSRLQFPNRERVTVSCPPSLVLQEGTYYKIYLFVPTDALLQKFSQEYVLFVDLKNYPPKQIEIGPKEYVESIQQEYNSAKGIALEALSGAMDRLVGDVSRKPETFIYELLQNADDYPDQKKGKVQVKFSIIDDFLVFQHTGLPFKANNVRAICNVNAGDKGDDLEKIGFKGMGFKSIFNHSNYVIINSGGFCFRFDEEYHLLKGKETFWSLIPVWTNELPSVLIDFQNQDYSVSVFIKAKEGNERLKSYYLTLEKIFNDERLLLFLRWVDKVEINGQEGDFVRNRDSASWEISDLDTIEVPQEQREILNHRIIVERTKVPEKYKDIQQVKIAFASKLSNGKMLQTENAKIYAYLPTELNFGFPFLLNADFIPDGNRSYLHADLEWNLFLFYSTGKELLKWVNKLWNKYLDASVYLMIPTNKELSSNQEDDERELFLSEFKRGIADAKSEISFISGIDNLTYTSDEIIIDNTGLFSGEILDTSFFYRISDYSSKKLINNSINAKRLKDANLEIENFSLNDFIEKIEIEVNFEILSLLIQRLSKQRKIKWLKWVEEKVSEGKLDSEIVLRLPLVFSKASVLSINEVIERKDFIISLVRFDEVKSPLEASGIIFSDNFFDSTPNILALISSDGNYLGDDLELFEKIIDIEKLFELSPKQKNEVFLFLEKLDGIEDKKLGKIQIFRSQSGENPKSLNQLITSDAASQPNWLKEFIFDINEEKVLNNRFKKLLVQDDNVFGNIFCVENTLESICGNIDETNVSEFYLFIIKMFTALPEDHGIKFKDLKWLYSASDMIFHKSEYFYAPSGLNKASKSKYKEFTSVIESQSEMKTLSYEANEFKKKLSLGALEGDFADVLVSERTQKLMEASTILDFLVANGENDFFEKFTIEFAENEYAIKQSNGILNYYTSDKKLIEYITQKEADLELLSSALYDSDLNKIGLLENEKLLNYLIENEFVDISLVQFVYQYKDDSDLCKNFLKNLKEVKIEAEADYGKKSDEFKIFELIAHLDDSELADFIDNIYIDEESLNSKNLSNDIWFKIDGKSKKIGIELSEILTEYLGKTYSKDTFKNKFRLPNNDEHWQKINKIFDSRNLTIEEIKNKLLELESVNFNAKQLIFWHFYFSENGISYIHENCLYFMDSYESNFKYYSEEAKIYLEQCLMEDIFNPFEYFAMTDFTPEDKIWVHEYCIELERVPDWVKEWVGRDDEKLEYLISIGLNGDESHVVEFRKAIEEKDKSKQNSFRSGVSKEMLKNTLVWIKEKKSIKMASDTLLPIYEELESHVAVEEILLPICSEDGIVLENYQSETQYHYKSSYWGAYKVEIQNAIWENGGEILDEILSEGFREDLNIINEGYQEELDLDDIINHSIPFEEDFYKTWENKERVKILVYPNSTFPQIVSYNEIKIAESYIDKSYILDNDEIYVLEKYKDSIPVIIKDELDEDDYRELVSRKNAKRSNYNEEIDNDPEQDLKKSDYQFSNREEKALMELFDNNPDPEFYKNWNLATLIKAIVELPERGYNVEYAKKNLVESHEYAQLEPVYLEGDEETEFTIMGRSAANGLLYLTVQAWQRLKSSDVNLFVNLGGSKSKLFTSQQEVLDYAMESSEFQIMRISMEPTAENINDLLDGNFDKKKIWLVFRMKNSEKTDYLFNSWKPNDDFGDSDELQLRTSKDDDL